jgi:hypothetical protein
VKLEFEILPDRNITSLLNLFFDVAIALATLIWKGKEIEQVCIIEPNPVSLQPVTKSEAKRLCKKQSALKRCTVTQICWKRKSWMEICGVPG